MGNSSRTNSSKSRRFFGLAAIPVAGLLLLSGTVAAQAFTPDVMEQVDHFVECFGWMIVDPVKHTAECGPGIFWPHDPVSNSSGSGGYKPPTTTIITTTGTLT